MNVDEINDLLEKYLSGDCSSDEKELIESWLEKQGRKKDEWLEMEEVSREKWLSSLYTDIQTSISPGNVEGLVIRRSFLRSWSAVAAAISIVFLSYFLYDVFHQNVNYTETKVAFTHRTRLVLADGTVVWLNSGSSLKYPEQFQGKSRDVFLNGEGFFEVAHNPEKPFIIHTGEVKTKVLGTIFNIKAYNEDSNVQVALLSGKVEMQGNKGSLNKSIILNPKQLGTYHKDQQRLVKVNDNNVDEYAAWRNGRIIFDETPLAEVLKTLSRSYEITFDADIGKLSQCRITGTFDTKEPIEHIIKTICVSIDAGFLRKAKNIKINGKGC